jgi:hypothetical protein
MIFAALFNTIQSNSVTTKNTEDTKFLVRLVRVLSGEVPGF